MTKRSAALILLGVLTCGLSSFSARSEEERSFPNFKPVVIDPKIRLSEPRGAPGAEIEVQGKGFAPGDIAILWDEEPEPFDWTTAPDGAFTVTEICPGELVTR